MKSSIWNSKFHIEYQFITELLKNYEKFKMNSNNDKEKIKKTGWRNEINETGWSNDKKFLLLLTRVFRFFEEIRRYPTVKFHQIAKLTNTICNSFGIYCYNRE